MKSLHHCRIFFIIITYYFLFLVNRFELSINNGIKTVVKNKNKTNKKTVVIGHGI